MSGKDLLSQDEIDALLHGVDSGDIDTSTAAMAPGAVTPCDFAGQDHLLRDRMPVLDGINERFALLFQAGLFNLLHGSAEISVGGIRTVKFSDYVHSLFVPASLNLIRVPPLRGTSLVVFDPRLVFSVVENFFGGDGRFQSATDGREFSQTENRVVRRMLDQVCVGMQEAWAPLLDVSLQYLRTEINPHFAGIVSPEERVVVSTFHVELDSGGGDFHITMPAAMLEPVRELPDAAVFSDRDDGDGRWMNALRRDVGEASVELQVELARAELTLRELMALRPGDIIPVDLPGCLTVTAAGVPVFEAGYGMHRGNMAVQVVRTKRDD